MSPLVFQALLAIVIGALVAVFAYAFNSAKQAKLSVGRIRARRRWFRIGGLFVVSGIVFGAQADAILYLAGLTLEDPRYVVPTLFAYAFVMLGVLVLNLILWLPERRVPDGPATASA